MKIYLLPLIFSSILYANLLDTTKKIVPIDSAFTIDATSDVFDNTLTYTHKPLLSCSPKIDAVYKVESKRQLKVIPRTTLYSGTNYRCNYKKEPFSFKTESLTVKDARYFKAEKLLRLSFSDAIDKKTLSEGIVLQKVNKLSRTNLKYTLLHENEKNIVLKINEPIQKSTIALKITKKLQTTQHTSLEKIFEKTFNNRERTVTLDKEKKAMQITDAPQMVALDTGGFALRIFLNDSLENRAEKFIEIEGVENFTVNRRKYINYSMREKLHLSDEPYYYSDVISADFKPNHHYKVTLKKGLQTYRELKEDKHYNLQTGDYAQAIVFENDKNYISNVGELGFSSVNVDHATLVIERLLDENIRYFMNFNGADINDVTHYSKEVFSKEITLNNQKNKILKQKFSFGSLSQKLPFGVYNITLRYSEVVDEEIQERSKSKVVFLSDLGISANLSKEQAFVTILSLSRAKPVAHAEIEIFAPNNELIGTATTNEDGVAIIEKKHLLEKKPRGILVKTSNDSNFLLLNDTINSPSPYDILKNSERFKAHIYFQSNILRPASKINALITVKDRDFISANTLPIKIILKEMYGKVLHEKIYHTDAYGNIDFHYQLDNADKTGNYLLQAFIGERLIGDKKLKVEAFIPPKIENHLETDKEVYQISELIELNISSAYLFGSPSSGLHGSMKFNARPIDFYHKDYKDYHFSNEQLTQKNVQSYIDMEEAFTLNQEGKASLILSPKLTQAVPSMLEAMIGVTVMDDTQPLSTYKKIKIYPYQAMVGLKIDQSSFEKGEQLRGKAILLDPLTGTLINRKLYAVIKKINWQYDYSDGEYNWHKETNIVGNFTLNSNEEFKYNIHDNGDYIIEVHDHLGLHSSSAEFDVWWWSYSNISPKNDLKSVEISFKDKLYKKDEKIEVTLKSPILEGELLLTLESDKVELYRQVKLHKGVAKVTLPIEVDMKRGLHIHATAFRASDTPSKLIPFRARGYKFVKPNRDEHKIKVTIEAPTVSKSKTSLSVKIHTDKPAKVLLSIVDRGILQLVEQKKPKLFDFFNDPAKIAISYYDLYDNLMTHVAEGKIIDFGAGDILSKKKKHLAPDLGKRIKPFMLWSGIVDVSGKETSINIDVPEFNGRASLVAIAINADSVGVSEQDIHIKDDIMLKPSYPKYLLKGDKIKVPLRIFNTTKEKKTLILSTSLSDNLSLALERSTITIAPNSSTTINAILHADKVGKGAITLIAKSGNERITKSVELPIYSPYSISTHTFKGISNRSQTFTPPKAYADAKVMITLSNNLIGALRDDLQYLVRYPHGCAEQTSSKISSMHYAKAFLKNDKLVGESKNFIRQGVKKLRNMQNYYGEFYYWSGGDHVHAYASLYAAQTLLELQRDGTEITDTFIKNIIKMLKSVATKNDRYEGSYSNFHRIYAAFILAEHKSLKESTANMLYEKKIYKGHFLATYYMAAILKMQGKEKIANKLYADNTYDLARYANKTYGNRTGNFESNVRDMFLHFIIKTAYFNKEAKDLITIQKEFSNLYSTQSKAIALKAISIYLGKPSHSKLNVDVKINNRQANYTDPTTITMAKLETPNITLTPNGSAMSYSIELIKHLPKKIKNSLSSTKEISISRQFIDENGDDVDLENLMQGEKIYSKVKIRNYGEIKNVVVSQRVPACLSIVNNNIKNQKAKFKNQNIHQEYREIRDDRVLNFINLKKKQEWDKSLKKYINIENQGVIFTPFMVTSQGECQLPAIITEAMYDTRVNDYAKERTNIVVKELNSSKKEPVSSQISFHKKAKELVLSLYKKEMTSNHADDFIGFFHYPLTQYYRETNASKAFVLNDKKKYFKDWGKRVYKNMKVEVIDSDNQKETKVKIVFDYMIDNGKKELTGVSRHLLTIIEVNNQLLIKSIELVK